MAGSTSHFSSLPSLHIARRRWNINFDHPTSFNHGKIIPLDFVPVLPGDTFKLTLSSLIRMSTPIAPIMDNIDAHVYSFFVPMRLVWEHTKEFFGENTTSAGPRALIYKIPAIKYGVDSASTAAVGSISHYLHKPLKGSSYNVSSYSIEASCLKERCYVLLWNEFYRSQQYQTPYQLYTDDNGRIALNRDTSTAVDFSTEVFTANKRFDYFTSATLSPQYSTTDVTLPLGDYAPIYFEPGEDNMTLYARNSVSPYNYSTWDDDQVSDFVTDYNSDLKATVSGVSRHILFDNSAALKVDLKHATAASINELRYAFAVQRWFERANYGNRYHEYIQAHYQVVPPLGLLQVPEILGEHHFRINIQQVLSTAGADTSSSTKLGQPGANSLTGDSAVIFKKAIVEHGFICTMIHTTHDRHYTQGLLREDLKREMLEIYSPEFATLGDQSILRAELMAQDLTNTRKATDVIGYNEHWAEYRYRESRASGLLDPNAPNSLNFWTLSDILDKTTVIDGSFLKEDRSAIANALVSGNSGPDYVADFYFNYDVVRPMPVTSIPGLIDHVGGF